MWNFTYSTFSSDFLQHNPHQEIVTTDDPGTKQEQVFASYVERMLLHRSANTRYTREQTIHWLSNLAGQMKQHSHTIFFIEQLQPDWLSGKCMLRAYDWFGVYLPNMLIGTLLGLAVTTFLLAFIDLAGSIVSILLGGFLG